MKTSFNENLDETEWHIWYAWYPIETMNHFKVYAADVLRKLSVDENGRSYYEYMPVAGYWETMNYIDLTGSKFRLYDLEFTNNP